MVRGGGASGSSKDGGRVTRSAVSGDGEAASGAGSGAEEDGERGGRYSRGALPGKIGDAGSGKSRKRALSSDSAAGGESVRGSQQTAGGSPREGKAAASDVDHGGAVKRQTKGALAKADKVSDKQDAKAPSRTGGNIGGGLEIEIEYPPQQVPEAQNQAATAPQQAPASGGSTAAAGETPSTIPSGMTPPSPEPTGTPRAPRPEAAVAAAALTPPSSIPAHLLDVHRPEQIDVSSPTPSSTLSAIPSSIAYESASDARTFLQPPDAQFLDLSRLATTPSKVTVDSKPCRAAALRRLLLFCTAPCNTWCPFLNITASPIPSHVDPPSSQSRCASARASCTTHVQEETLASSNRWGAVV